MTLSDVALMIKNDSVGQVEKTIVINDEFGLHARPAARLAQAAQEFQSSITLEYADVRVNAKSILDILTLSAGQGASLVLRCQGTDAGLAAAKLAALFDNAETAEM